MAANRQPTSPPMRRLAARAERIADERGAATSIDLLEVGWGRFGGRFDRYAAAVAEFDAAAGRAFASSRTAPLGGHRMAPDQITAAPDLGRELARFITLRALNYRKATLGRIFKLTFEQVNAVLAVHGEPPRIGGAARTAVRDAVRREMPHAAEHAGEAA